MTEQLERGMSAYKRNKRHSGRWWTKFYTKRMRRRALKRQLDNAPLRFTRGYEF